MQHRNLGQRTGLRVSQLALGTGMFGTAGGYGAEADEAARIFDAYVEAGGNFIDTSDAYQRGQAETLIGSFTQSRRNEFVITSKYSRGAAAQATPLALGNSRRAMIRSVEDSLRRLKTDRLDVYLPHFDDGITPIDEIVRGLDDLVRAGKVIYAGLSNFPAWRVGIAATLADLRGWTPLAVLQLQFSLIDRAADSDLLPMGAALGLGLMGYSPLAGGRLTGKYRRGEGGRATALKGSIPDGNARSDLIIDAVSHVAEQTGHSASAVAIAWLDHKGVIPIIGPRTLAQAQDNLTAATVTLDQAQVDYLDEASAFDLQHPHDLLAAQRHHLGLTDPRSGRVA